MEVGPHIYYLCTVFIMMMLYSVLYLRHFISPSKKSGSSCCYRPLQQNMVVTKFSSAFQQQKSCVKRKKENIREGSIKYLKASPHEKNEKSDFRAQHNHYVTLR